MVHNFDSWHIKWKMDMKSDGDIELSRQVLITQQYLNTFQKGYEL